MKRERTLHGVLAGLMLLVAYRALAVPAPPQALPCATTQVGIEAGLATCGGAAPLTGSQARVLGLPLDVNRATPLELETLPGIGTTLAERIVNHRAAGGPFHSIDELRQVAGIGPAKLEALRGRVTVGNVAP